MQTTELTVEGQLLEDGAKVRRIMRELADMTGRYEDTPREGAFGIVDSALDYLAFGLETDLEKLRQT